jgi:Domain of unknown function (DUF1996)
MLRKLTAALVVGLAIFVGSATQVSAANFIVGCLASHTNNDDPIVFPGRPGASHSHTYTGARTTNAFSTFASLVASPTTCGTPGDRSGYWQPTWYPVHPNKGLLVYMSVTANTRPFPNGLKMIVRWSSGRIRFKCGPGSNTETPAPPPSCGSGMFVPVIDFPRFWDGVRLDSPDHISHMSYSRDAGHPVELPRMKWYFRMAVPAGAPINPNHSAGSYQNYHVDFFDGWVKADLQRLMNQCLNSNCGINPQ